uniref:Metalloendopeptidase n=1 Tax=Crassostrea virginica TaxID=6565 RepID=A0A8B8C9M6_CRAVI|nr:uncharacterized protein LOC111117490 [Crassostrea virginica]
MGKLAICWVALIVVVQLDHADGRSYMGENEDLIREIEQELEKYESHEARIRNENSGDSKESKEDAELNENKIDEKDVDTDDPAMRLLLSMGVEIDGVVKSPKGLHPENAKNVKAKNLDQTIETKEESEKEGVQRKERRKKRNFGPNWPNWPKGIVPYVFDSSIVANRKYFLQAVELFNNLTCIRWKERSTEVEAEVGHKGYVKVQSGSGCSAGVGFYGDDEHIINLKEPGCGTVGISVHEMLHRIGQRHEQSRSDRDQYVKIAWNEISPDWRYNYYRRLTYNRNPYDIGSVMQYGYGGEGSSIELKDKNLLFLEFPGSQVFSFYDIKDVLDQYKCTEKCSSGLTCTNEGYMNVECKCECPLGFTGSTCETVVTDSDCGGYVHLQDSDPIFERDRDVTVTSPNYPGQISVGKICRWAITAPAGFIIKMTVDDLHMAYNPDTLRCYHWLEIQYNLPGQPGIRRCGDIVGETFLSSVDSPTLMIVTMDTKFAGGRATHKGFKLHFEKEKEVCRDNPCVYGVCVPTQARKCQYKCVCQSGYTGEKCNQVVADAKIKCTFERLEKCFFDNVKEGDQFEWGPGFKHTISEGTGPEEAFRGERFLFAEMSLPRVPGDKAILQTAVPLPAKASCLSFAYNMFGRNVNKLTLYAEGTNAGKTTLWSKQGNQGSDWFTAKVNIPETQGLKLSFEAITGDSWDSDVALDEVTWGIGQCGADTFNECIKVGEEYTGTRDYTKKGVKCQAWNSSTPNTVPSKYRYLASESNYCRIADEPSPWCYTTDPGTRWDWCSVPYCFATECTLVDNGQFYTGTVSHTKSGLPCQRWDSQTPHPHGYNALNKDENYCRNTDGSQGPWCYTQDPDTRWELCDVPRCERIHRDCLLTGRGLEYSGNKSVAASGKTCMNWPQESMKDEANYCRNVDGSSRPWCFVQGETGPVKEYCSIPLCSDSPCFPNPCKNRGQCIVNDTTYFCTCLDGFSGDTCEIENLTAEADCKRTNTGWEYVGKRNITTSGRTCQTWSSDSPHSHSFNDLPENYCRNPDREPSPWCYTTDPNKRWEYCSISDCVTPPLECIQNSDPKGALYFGTQNVADTGDPCQRWDSQSPHQHSYGWLGDQDNYCRNSGNSRGPWCYTENPDKRWAYCHVPKC